MTARGLLFLAMAALPASAELRLLWVSPSGEQNAGQTLDIGATAAGEPLDLRFRVRNVGLAADILRTISVAGSGFTLRDYPMLPYTLAAAASVDFQVRFLPTAVGAFSASLTLNGAATILRGTGVAAPALVVEGGASGEVVDFGRVERGSSVGRRFRLENKYPERVHVSVLSVEGGGFRGPVGLEAPAGIDPGASASFEVFFEPRSAGGFEGELRVDRRTLKLRGTGLEIPLPKPRLELEDTAPSSARQVRLAVHLSEPARISGSGELQLEFQGAGPDPTVVFLPSGSRFAGFTVREGESLARFGDRDSIAFQTGTTAGSILFTARLGGVTHQATVTIPPAPVGVETARATRTLNGVEAYVQGFDNTRSITDIGFTFETSAGTQPTLRIDASKEFQKYFESSPVGGAFLLRAAFPVTGNPTQITAVEIEIRNSAGLTRIQRLGF